MKVFRNRKKKIRIIERETRSSEEKERKQL